MCNNKCAKKNNKFTRRELFKVINAVEEKISSNQSFTSLDIVEDLADESYLLPFHKVSSILAVLIQEEEFPELEITKINVVRSDYKVVKASLYHLEGSNPFDYMNICQLKKPEKSEVDFDEIKFTLSDDDLYSDLDEENDEN